MRAIWTKKKIVSRKEKIAVIQFLAKQLILLLVIASIIAAIGHYSAAKSALLGGLLVWIPNVFLVFFIFSQDSISDPKKIVNAFYVGEVLKILLMCILFVLMLHWYTIALIPFLIGMAGAYLVYLFLG